MKQLCNIFSCLQQCKNFFLFHLFCMQFFSSNKRLQEIFFKIMAAFAESAFVKLHKNDYSRHNPSRESTVGSWYCQQGLQKGS